MSKISIRSRHIEAAEISWFAPICDGDDRYLGERNDRFKSNWENTSEIVKEADNLGYRNILCPSSYQVGQDTLPFVSALSPLTRNINLLAAVRCGEIHPPMLARTLATIDHILKGRLTVNIISSNLPGEDLDSASRYQRSREVIQILKQCWTQDEIDFKGEFYQFKLSSNPGKSFQDQGPLLYFGGYSPSAIDLCAEFCDVYLMWPETESKLQEHMVNMSEKAAQFGRTVDFGLRVHVVVREDENEARAYADSLLSKLDLDTGTEIRERALDAKSFGVSKQSAMRAISDEEGYAEKHLWTGIGKARSGCGAALVGNPEQIIEKIHRYMEMGIRSFIFSGYPHLNECREFARLVLPHLKTCSFPIEQNKVGNNSGQSPLGNLKRV
ncbi:MAG: LLM class flavin-dependent oxidoreductase [Bacteroidota bacterium]